MNELNWHEEARGRSTRTRVYTLLFSNSYCTRNIQQEAILINRLMEVGDMLTTTLQHNSPDPESLSPLFGWLMQS